MAERSRSFDPRKQVHRSSVDRQLWCCLSFCGAVAYRVLRMGIAHRVYPDIGFTLVVWHGPVSVEHAVNHLVRLAADPLWPPGLLHLTDIRTATSVTLPDPELLDLLFEGSPWRDTDLDKVVVVRAGLLHRTTVQDAAASLGMNAKPFVDLDAACAHLGVDAVRVATTIDELRAEVESAVNNTSSSPPPSA